MITISNNIVDFLSTVVGVQKYSSGLSDDTFVQLLRNHTDLWKRAFVENNITCCPVSVSLGGELSRDHLLSHILVPDRRPGEYRTLRNEQVYISGNEVICGVGFSEARKIKILSVEQMTDVHGNVASVLKLSRPLVGGIAAPEEIDEISLQVMFKYVAILRSFPEAESAFFLLDEYLKEVNFVGYQSRDGFSRVTPSLSASLHAQWERTTERLLRSGVLTTCLGTDAETSKQLIGQIVESYIMSTVAGTVYPWLSSINTMENRQLMMVIREVNKCTLSDLGVSPELQAPQNEAIAEIITISRAKTPVDKMLVMKRTVVFIRESVDRHAQRNFPGAEVDMATDDLVLLLIYTIAQAYPHYSDLADDVRYVSEFHFISSSRSQLGFTLCHFQVALTWFMDRSSRVAEVPIFPGSNELSPDINTAVPSAMAISAAGGTSSLVGSPSAILATVATQSPQYLEPLRADLHVVRKLEDDFIGHDKSVVDAFGCESDVTAAIQPPIDQTASNVGHADDKRAHDGASSISDLVTPSIPPSMCRIAAKMNEAWVVEVAASSSDHLVTESPQLVPPLPSSGAQPLSMQPTESESGLTTTSSIAIGAPAAAAAAAAPAAAAAIKSGSRNADSNYKGSELASIRSAMDATGTRIVVLGDSGSYGSSCVEEIAGPSAAIPTTDRIKQSLTILSERTNRPGGILSVTGSDDYFAAVNVDLHAHTWGQPGCGRLGHGVEQELDHFMPVPRPREVTGMGPEVRIRQLACGKLHMLAVTDAGEVFSWGDNRCLQLGVSGPSSDIVSKSIGGGLASSGATASVASLSSSVFSRGRGQILDDPMANFHSTNKQLSIFNACAPTPVVAMKHVRAQSVACGAYHSLCLTVDGEVYSWGRAANGRLGQFLDTGANAQIVACRPGAVNCSWECSILLPGQMNDTPALTAEVSTITSSSKAQSAGLMKASKSSFGAAAAAAASKYSFLERISHGYGRPPARSGSTQASSGYLRGSQGKAGCARDHAGKGGNIGAATSRSPSTTPSGTRSVPVIAPSVTGSALPESNPMQRPTKARVVAIAAGFSHSVAVTSTGAVFTWGCGTYGRLGHGSHSDEFLPKQVSALSSSQIKIVQAAAGMAHTVFVSDKGLVFACGLNSSGQVGPTLSAGLRRNISATQANARPQAWSASTDSRGSPDLLNDFGIPSKDGHQQGSPDISRSKLDRYAVLVPRPTVVPPVSVDVQASCSAASTNECTSGETVDAEIGSAGATSDRVWTVSCGNAHTAVITRDGRALLWGAANITGARRVLAHPFSKSSNSRLFAPPILCDSVTAGVPCSASPVTEHASGGISKPVSRSHEVMLDLTHLIGGQGAVPKQVGSSGNSVAFVV